MVKLQLDCVPAAMVEKSMCNWVGADMVESISGASVGAAAQFFVKSVYTKEILVVCSSERSKQKLGAECTKDVLVSLCRHKWQIVLE